jgi:WD40 repeat protein
MAALSANDVADIIPQDILAVSSNGFMQHIPAIDDSNSNIYDTESLQLFCTPSFTATDEYITSCSVSSTGCFVACGTSAGTVIQRSATMAVDEDLIVNTVWSLIVHYIDSILMLTTANK